MQHRRTEAKSLSAAGLSALLAAAVVATASCKGPTSEDTVAHQGEPQPTALPPREGPLPCGAWLAIDSPQESCSGEWVDDKCVVERFRYSYDDQDRLVAIRQTSIGAAEASHTTLAYDEDEVLRTTTRWNLDGPFVVTRVKEETLRIHGSLLAPIIGTDDSVTWSDQKVESDELGRPTALSEAVEVLGDPTTQSCTFEYDDAGGRPILGLTPGYTALSCRQEGGVYFGLPVERWDYDGPKRGPSRLRAQTDVYYGAPLLPQQFEYECPALPAKVDVEALLPIELGATRAEVYAAMDGTSGEPDEALHWPAATPWGRADIEFLPNEVIGVRLYRAPADEEVRGTLARDRNGKALSPKPLGLSWGSSSAKVVDSLGPCTLRRSTPKKEEDVPAKSTLVWIFDGGSLLCSFEADELTRLSYSN